MAENHSTDDAISRQLNPYHTAQFNSQTTM